MGLIPHPPRAIFWDSDNTVVDTFALHWAKHFYTLRDLGITLDEAHKKRIYQLNGAQNWQWMKDELGLTLSCEEYLKKIDAYYKSNAESLKPRAGIVEILELAAAKNIPQIIVSNGRRESVEAAHNATGLHKYFKFLWCAEDYKNKKPHPEPFETALKKLNKLQNSNILSHECLAIDDDGVGIESAKKAGMFTLFRPTEFSNIICNDADLTVETETEFLNLCRNLLRSV